MGWLLQDEGPLIPLSTQFFSELTNSWSPEILQQQEYPKLVDSILEAATNGKLEGTFLECSQPHKRKEKKLILFLFQMRLLALLIMILHLSCKAKLMCISKIS